MEISKQYSLDQLKYLVPNKQALYDILTKSKGYYLPKFTSKCITEEYLLSVARKQVFTIEKDKVKIGEIQKHCSISDLIELLQKNVNIKLGFTEDNFPDKIWLINCLFSLAPNDDIFKLPLSSVKREFPEEYLLSF